MCLAFLKIRLNTLICQHYFKMVSSSLLIFVKRMKSEKSVKIYTYIPIGVLGIKHSEGDWRKKAGEEEKKGCGRNFSDRLWSFETWNI